MPAGDSEFPEITPEMYSTFRASLKSHVVALGCRHHDARLNVREKLAFSNEDQLQAAYAHLQQRHPRFRACRILSRPAIRIEVFAAEDDKGQSPSTGQLTELAPRVSRHSARSAGTTGVQ